MTYLKYLFLGFIQGITEALPISSSGHLLIFKNLLNVDVDFDTLAIITNFGSLIAIMIYFRKDIIDLIKGFFGYFKDKKKNQATFKYCWLVVLGCIPAGIVGLIVKKLDLLNAIDDNVKVVGILLLMTSAFLFLIRKFDGSKTDKDLTWKEALKIGSFQIAGVLPGISRSGSTIVGGMFSGLKRDTAFKYSFILYIPMSLAASLLEIKDLFEVTIDSTLWICYIIATIMAFIFTLIGVKWFRKIVNEGKLIYFSVYCLIAGTLVLIFL